MKAADDLPSAVARFFIGENELMCKNGPEKE
jgi:hypothetical protein